MKIEWKDKKHFSINRINFRLIDFIRADVHSKIDQFVVSKHDWMIRDYEKLISQLNPRFMFELGIQRGGSAIFFQQLSGAEKLVSIELGEDRIAALDEVIEQRGLQGRICPHYGIDQGDEERMKKIIDDEFGNNEIDLVIDDASHFLNESRKSFNVLFPKVRAGGVYVIEDWSWAHGNMSHHDDERALYPDREPLTKLIFELVLACPSDPGLIQEIRINKNSAYIVKGDGPVEEGEFDIRKKCLARGRQIIRY